MTDDVRMGIYRHYKGPLYQVIGIAHDANADDLGRYEDGHWTVLSDRIVVVYMPLQLNAAHTGPRMCVRTREDFTAWVHPDDGSICVPARFMDGTDRKYTHPATPRFEYLGQELTEEMVRQAFMAKSMLEAENALDDATEEYRRWLDKEEA